MSSIGMPGGGGMPGMGGGIGGGGAPGGLGGDPMAEVEKPPVPRMPQRMRKAARHGRKRGRK